ncbi:MAG: hypothetical protein ACOCTT_03505 [archaeon]
MKIELTEEDAKQIMKDWDNLPEKYGTLKNYEHGGTTNFKCKYIRDLIKKIEDVKE